MLRIVAFIVGVLGTTSALAQKPPTPTDQAIMLALELQRAGSTAQTLANALATAQQRIADLEKKCGDACK